MTGKPTAELPRWRAEQAGWGSDWCITCDGLKRPILHLIKPTAYFTDFPPSKSDPDAVVLSEDAARESGRYVATPAIRAEIERLERERAELIAEAMNAAEDCEKAGYDGLEAVKALPELMELITYLARGDRKYTYEVSQISARDILNRLTKKESPNDAA